MSLQIKSLTIDSGPTVDNSLAAQITLEPGDMLQAKADVGGVIQYVISGVERDMA